MNNTLSKLFPETNDYNTKIWKFLELSYSKGWSYRATSKRIKYWPQDSKEYIRICEKIQKHIKYLWTKIEATVQSFSDKNV